MIALEFQEYVEFPIYRLTIKDVDKELGFYLLIPQAIDIYEVHTHMIPEAYGSAVTISKEALKMTFDNLADLNTLITKVPINNPLAKRLCLKVGMKQYGTLPKSFKTSSWIDQELFYINREDLECQ